MYTQTTGLHFLEAVKTTNNSEVFLLGLENPMVLSGNHSAVTFCLNFI